MKLNKHHKQAGSSLVEFSIVLLLFLIFIFGVYEGGIAVWSYNNLADGVRDGARFAIVRGGGARVPDGSAGPETESTTCDAVTTEKVVPVVCQFAMPLVPSRLSVTVTWPTGNSMGDHVIVHGSYDYRPITGLIDFSMVFESQSEMQIACCTQ